MPRTKPLRRPSGTPGMTLHRSRAWITVFACGVLAAMHIWKFPGAMEFIRNDLSMTLVEAGVLLGIVQVASMLLGLVASLFAERLGLRSALLIGLALLAVGSAAGAGSEHTWQLMTTRALEGVGFLLVTVVGPPLIRALAAPSRVNIAMGWWAAFQGTAVFLAYVLALILLDTTALATWRGWWIIMAVLSGAAIAAVVWWVPTDGAHRVNFSLAFSKILATVKTLMPWIIAIIFAVYTLQWGTIIGFLPDIVEGSGLGTGIVALAAAVVGGMNAVGNVVAGGLLQRGVAPRGLVIVGLVSMMGLTTLLFAPDWGSVGGGAWWQFAIAGAFSGVAAVIPSVLTRIAVEVAPADGSPAAVIGLVNQTFNASNFVGPIILTALATVAGTWRLSWTVTVSSALIGLVLAVFFLRGPAWRSSL